MSVLWRYKAYREAPGGTIEYEHDTIVADGDPAVALRQRGLKLIRAQKTLFGSAIVMPGFGLTPRILQTFWDNMAGLTHLSAAEAVRTCAERTANRKLAQLLRKIERSLRAGMTFADALAHCPQIPGLHAAIVAASGERGTAESRAATYHHLSQMTDNSAQLSTKMRKTAFHLLAVGAAALGGLRLLAGAEPVIDTFSRSLSGSATVAQPAVTRIAEVFIAAMTGPAATVVTLVVFTSIVLGMVAVRLNADCGRLYERMLYAIPRFGKIARMIDTARVTRALSATLRVYDAAEAVARVSNVAQRHVVADSLALIEQACRGKHGRGNTSLSDAVRLAGSRFDPLFAEYLVGARAGATVDALAKVADVLDRDAYAHLNDWADTVEPVVGTVILLGFYALVFFLTIPLFGLLQTAATMHTPTYYVP